MHPQNPFQKGYDFQRLTASHPPLKAFVKQSPQGRKTIDFANAEAVKALNSALLKSQYGLSYWDLPVNALCPGVPGRLDYILHLKDLLDEDGMQSNIKGLDIGTGASVIYPLLGANQYGWEMVGSDSVVASVEFGNHILKQNTKSQKLIDLRHQPKVQQIFADIIQPNEAFSFTMCNPPFHASVKEAAQGTLRKAKNLQRHREKRGQRSQQTNRLNFSGQHHELWCPGGEVAFIKRMMDESVKFQHQVSWFTSLIAKKDHVKPLETYVRQYTQEYRLMAMGQGSKVSRFIAWRF